MTYFISYYFMKKKETGFGNTFFNLDFKLNPKQIKVIEEDLAAEIGADVVILNRKKL